MAINKNFVIKNGVEVNTSLIVGDATLNKVGVGTTVPGYTIHVGGSRGGIGATDLTITGIATVGTSGSTSAALSVVGVSSFQGDVNFLGSAGVSTITFDASLDKLNFADNARATFGADDDLQIFHDGSNSIIRETGTGNIVLEGSGETLAVFADDGAVSLYYDNANVFQTTPQGVNVSGVTTSNRLNISGVSTFTSIGSNLIPDGDGSRNIGAAGSEWQDLHIDGTANIDTLAADTAAIGDLTENRVVIAGSSGELEDDSNFTFDGTTLAVTGKETVSVDITVGSGVTIQNHGGLSVAGISTFGGLVNVDGGISITGIEENKVIFGSTNGGLQDSSNLTFDGAGLVVTGGINVTGVTTAATLAVTGIATAKTLIVGNEGLTVSGASTFSGQINAGTAATIATNGNASFSGIVTASLFQGGGIGVGIGTTGDGSAGFHTVGFGFTFLDLKGPGISTVYANSSTGIATIFFQGGGTAGAAGTWTPEGSIGVSTSKSVGVNTVALNDPDVQGIGNSFQGLYIGNGMLLVDNALNGNHYIGTAKNGLMAGPVTINGVLTVDGNYVVV